MVEIKKDNKTTSTSACNDKDSTIDAHNDDGADFTITTTTTTKKEEPAQPNEPYEPPAKRANQGPSRNKSNRNAISNATRRSLCPYMARGHKVCPLGKGECRSEIHDVDQWLLEKPEDIPGILCKERDDCRFGLLCRLSSTHLQKKDDESQLRIAPLWSEESSKLFNVFKQLRKREYAFPKADFYLEELKKVKKSNGDIPTTTMIDTEKKRICWKGKTILAPLTTVGNLPFRRICKEYGADVTVGEMAMATSILQGKASEWALMKRHHTEDVFGVQLCGGFSDSLSRAAELIATEADCDFIDLNMGCPIDQVYRKGMGSGLMEKKRRVEEIVGGMKHSLLSTCVELTLKMRIGVKDGKDLALSYVPMLQRHSVSLLTVHGRTKQQRYTKEADWSYIRKVNEAADATGTLNVCGNGDILTWQDWKEQQNAGVQTWMIGRGALIKPWIFQEIKEQRTLDPGPGERMEMLKRFASHSLEHFGSDQAGVEKGRRFMLEWQSFLCRYIPSSLLVDGRQRMNERPPAYRGRDEMETLMASPISEDWIKLSEHIFGAKPDSLTFIPKHRSNSYEAEG